MAKIEARAALRGGVALLSALWIAYTIHQEFFDVDPDQFGFKSPEVEAEMKTCVGTFQERYLCKEAIIIAKQHESFLDWLQSALLILGPPLAASALLARFEPPPRPPDDLPWQGRRPIPIRRFRVR